MIRPKYAFAKFDKLIIWQKEDGTIYYRSVKNGFGYNIGDLNGYGHKIIFIIELNSLFKEYRVPLKHRIINRLINWLERLKK